MRPLRFRSSDCSLLTARAVRASGRASACCCRSTGEVRPGSGGGSIDYAWQLNGIYAKVLLQDGQAYAQGAAAAEPLGAAESVIRRLGLVAGADQSQIAAATSALEAPAPNASPASHRWLQGGIGVGVLAAVVVIILWKRRSKRGGESLDG